jgi:stage V sporulation protein AC
MKPVSKQEYAKMAEQAAPRSPVAKDCTLAFLVGGLICTFGQFLYNVYRQWGFSMLDARCGVSVTLIFITAVLTALHLFDKIAKHAGAGTLVPITGFANAMVSPAIEFRSEGMITGLGVKMFTIAGPVLVFGFSATIIYGLVLWVVSLFT